MPQPDKKRETGTTIEWSTVYRSSVFYCTCHRWDGSQTTVPWTTEYMNYAFSLGIRVTWDSQTLLCVCVCAWDLKRISDTSDPSAAAPCFCTKEFSVLQDKKSRGRWMCSRAVSELHPNAKLTSSKLTLPSPHFQAECNFKRAESLGCGLEGCKYRPTPTPALGCSGLPSPHQSWVNPEHREYSVEVS